MEPGDDLYSDSSSTGGNTTPQGEANSSDTSESSLSLPALTGNRDETQEADPPPAQHTDREDHADSNGSADGTATPETKEAENAAELSKDNSPSEANPSDQQRATRAVLRTKQLGVWTFKTLESTNFIKEWYKAARVSGPYLLRLFKLFWKLSPSRVSVMIAVNLLRAIFPSLTSWRIKQFLDEIQLASLGNPPRTKRLVALVILAGSQEWILYLLNVISYAVIALWS
jgi:hypothetical protein